METKFTRKLNDLEAALSNFRDALTLQPSLFPELVADSRASCKSISIHASIPFDIVQDRPQRERKYSYLRDSKSVHPDV